jgi:hypothetical protein
MGAGKNGRGPISRYFLTSKFYGKHLQFIYLCSMCDLCLIHPNKCKNIPAHTPALVLLAQAPSLHPFAQPASSKTLTAATALNCSTGA